MSILFSKNRPPSNSKARPFFRFRFLRCKPVCKNSDWTSLIIAAVVVVQQTSRPATAWWSPDRMNGRADKSDQTSRNNTHWEQLLWITKEWPKRVQCVQDGMLESEVPDRTKKSEKKGKGRLFSICWERERSELVCKKAKARRRMEKMLMKTMLVLAIRKESTGRIERPTLVAHLCSNCKKPEKKSDKHLSKRLLLHWNHFYTSHQLFCSLFLD